MSQIALQIIKTDRVIPLEEGGMFFTNKKTTSISQFSTVTLAIQKECFVLQLHHQTE